MAPHEGGYLGLQRLRVALMGRRGGFDGASIAVDEGAQRISDVAHLAFGHLNDAPGVGQPR